MEQENYRRLIQLEARVQRMEAMMQALLVRLGVDVEEVTPQEPQRAQELRAVREALLAGQKILAIKLYRELYGVSLREGKEAVEAMERELRG
jgi:ribosomal protein L7/L12